MVAALGVDDHSTAADFIIIHVKYSFIIYLGVDGHNIAADFIYLCYLFTYLFRC